MYVLFNNTFEENLNPAGLHIPSEINAHKVVLHY